MCNCSARSRARAAQNHARLAFLIVADFQVCPAEPLAPAGAQALQNRLLGCPAPGKMLGRVLAALAIANLRSV